MTIISLFKCQYCSQYLCLDDEIRSKNDKMIPLNATGEYKHEKHECPENPFVKQYYHLRQMPEGDYEKGKVSRAYLGDGIGSTFDTSEGSFSHTNEYEWKCNWCGEIYPYRIKAMKCCTNEQDWD